jgi:hypothetical protein
MRGTVSMGRGSRTKGTIRMIISNNLMTKANN